MDAFVFRKKRKLSFTHSPDTSASTSTQETSPIDLQTRTDSCARTALAGLQDDDESTDFKLAILSSLHPDISQQMIWDVLISHDGSVEDASAALQSPDTPAKRSAATGYQSCLSSFVTPLGSTDIPAKKAKLLSKRGKTLHLYSPEDVAAHTPCSIIHNFLPSGVASDLLKELLLEAPTFQRDTFKLFDNVVQSPHTSALYVEDSEEQNVQKTEYIYNGSKLEDVRQLTAQMQRVSPLVQEAVNREIEVRTKEHQNGQRLKFQTSEAWQPNVALVNCYKGGGESVGYHSDQLTYLGPRAVIGSISLGVAREFRVRRVIPRESDSRDKSKEASDEEGQIAIHLPHNSLLVMHAEMQEEWKHSIAPVAAIDPHPVAGNTRINITYRYYKKSLHPKLTPRCKCGVPTVLRVVQKKKDSRGKYFWMCYAGSSPGLQGCTFFEWAEFDDEGNPVWKEAHRPNDASTKNLSLSNRETMGIESSDTFV